MQYSFDVQDAVKYGLHEAIFLHNLKFWCLKNIANQKHLHPVNAELYPDLIGQSRTFTYNSVSAFSKIFPFWSDKQIRTTIDTLLKEGVIIKGNYNKAGMDRTMWYALQDESILPTGQMDLPQRAKGFDPQGEPIPDSKPDSKPENTGADKPPHIPTLEEKQFIAFQKWIEENAPSVAKVKEPITCKQLAELIKKYGKEPVKEVLMDMHNKPDLTKKYTSASRTANNWLKRNSGSSQAPGKIATIYQQPSTAAPLRSVNDL